MENNGPASGGDDVSGAADALMKQFSGKGDGDEPETEQEDGTETESETAEDSEQEQPEDSAEEKEEEDAEADDGDAQPDEKANPDDSIKVKLRVGDEEREVTLADLKRGYMVNADYTRKTQELSEARKGFIAEATQYHQSVQSQIEQVGFLANTFMQQLVNTEQTTDWNALRQTNPAEYAARQHDMNERRALLQRAFAMYQQSKQQEEAISGATMQQHLGEQTELLVSLVPEWVDPRVASSEKKALAKYLVDQGVPIEEIESLSDSRTVAIARKAMLYDRLQAAKQQATQKQTKQVPKFTKPGPRDPAPTKSLHQKLDQRARKSGRHEDYGASLAAKYGAL